MTPAMALVYATLAVLRDRRMAITAEGLLHDFNLAGVIESSDIHVATRLACLRGERYDTVLLAIALTVKLPARFW